MALAAAQVIDAIAARLTSWPGKVFTDRAWPIGADDLPAWRVTAQDESIERLYITPSVNEHVLSVDCEGLVRAVTGLDDAMHALAAQGMAQIFADPVPYELQLTSITRRQDPNGESAVGVITVGLTARFAVDQSAPEIIQ